MQNASEKAKNIVKNANGSTVALDSLTRSSKAAAIGMKALSIAGNMLAFLAISEVITRTASVISDYVNAAKIAEENTEALSSSLTESQNKYAEDSRKIEELSSRYETLSKGVNHFGQNVSLSSSQYDEYKSIIKQLSEIMPGLTLRFNEQGEAIGFVGGKLKDINEKYHEYQKNQAEKFLQEGDSDGKTYQDALDNLNEQLSDEKDLWDSFITEKLSQLGIMDASDNLTAKESIVFVYLTLRCLKYPYQADHRVRVLSRQMMRSDNPILFQLHYSVPAFRKNHYRNL